MAAWVSMVTVVLLLLVEKMAEAKRAYEGFVRKKDMIRIRMPDEPERVVGGHWKPPRLDFSKNGVVRKKQVRSYERVES